MQTDRLAPARVLPTPGTPRRRHRVVWTPTIGSGLLRAKRSPERGEARKCGNSPSAFNELNFRDAKQSWGLEDFLNITPTGVTQAANLALCLVNVAYRLRADGYPRQPDSSVLALQADGRRSQYGEETIKMLPEKPKPVL